MYSGYNEVCLDFVGLTKRPHEQKQNGGKPDTLQCQTGNKKYDHYGRVT